MDLWGSGPPRTLIVWSQHQVYDAAVGGHDHRGHDHDHGHSHGHDHGHGHDRGHSENRSGQNQRLLWGFGLTAGYMVAEVVGGWWTGSLALLADAGHMLSDAASLLLAIFAIWVAQRPPNRRRTYGYHRIEILAALVQASALFVVAWHIFEAAIFRLKDPPEVNGLPMLMVACGGLLVNLVILKILHGDHHNVNVRGAWLHVMSDTLGSLGAITSGILVWGWGLRWADPAASLMIAVLVAFSAWPLLKQTLGILMESAPLHIDVAEVKTAMESQPGVTQVHDLHVWTLTQGRDCLSGHVVVAVGQPKNDILRGLRQLLHDRFGLEHVTLQLEEEACPEGEICA